MKLAIVGSIDLKGNEEAARIIEEMLDSFAPSLVISGGAVGIDTMAEQAAKCRNIETSIYHPKTDRWRDGFMPRNLLIAQACDVLVRIVASNSVTYGSGWTRDRAAGMGKQTFEYVVEIE